METGQAAFDKHVTSVNVAMAIDDVRPFWALSHERACRADGSLDQICGGGCEADVGHAWAGQRRQRLEAETKQRVRRRYENAYEPRQHHDVLRVTAWGRLPTKDNGQFSRQHARPVRRAGHAASRCGFPGGENCTVFALSIRAVCVVVSRWEHACMHMWIAVCWSVGSLAQIVSAPIQRVSAADGQATPPWRIGSLAGACTQLI